MAALAADLGVLRTLRRVSSAKRELMKRVELEVFSEETNAAIVRMRGRRFPGMVIQGDSLCTLQQSAESIVQMAERGMAVESVAEAKALASRLHGLLQIYERVLAAHDISLPYSATPRFLR